MALRVAGEIPRNPWIRSRDYPDTVALSSGKKVPENGHELGMMLGALVKNPCIYGIQAGTP